jgi:hypothetical protein
LHSIPDPRPQMLTMGSVGLSKLPQLPRNGLLGNWLVRSRGGANKNSVRTEAKIGGAGLRTRAWAIGWIQAAGMNDL